MQTLTTALFMVALLLSTGNLTAQAESLFRANAAYTGQDLGYRPNSWFMQPIPHAVGDILTVTINEKNSHKNTTELAVERTHTTQQNSNAVLSNIMHSLGVPKRITIPNLNGINDSNEVTSAAQAGRTAELTDNVTVQVVQILPNGNLIIQGKKTVLVNRETVDMLVSGIVNPYYLNARNEIASSQVADFQILMGSKGVLTRPQSDGFTSKMMQWFQ